MRDKQRQVPCFADESSPLQSRSIAWRGADGATATFIARSFVVIAPSKYVIHGHRCGVLLAIEQTDGVVVANAEDMSMSVTRSELREELQPPEKRTDHWFERVDQRFDPLSGQLAKTATITDLEAWGEAMAARFVEIGARLDAQFERIANEFRALREVDLPRLEENMRIEFARHSFANYEAMLSAGDAGDEKYADLPGRMRRLEAMLFPNGR
jgi:hypothetical protein